MSVFSFRVPFGVDEHGLLVSPDKAARIDKYTCPECSSRLTLKAGPIVRRHFAHRPDSLCTSESAIHAAAKIMVKQTCEAWFSGGGPTPVLRYVCKRCGQPGLRRFRRPRARRGVSVGLEKRVGKYVVDVLVSFGDCPVFAVEVFKTHTIEEEKAKDIGLMWVELDADSILAGRGWKVTRSSFTFHLCSTCRAHVRRPKKQLVVGLEKGIATPQRLSRYRGWRRVKMIRKTLPQNYHSGAGNRSIQKILDHMWYLEANRAKLVLDRVRKEARKNQKEKEIPEWLRDSLERIKS